MRLALLLLSAKGWSRLDPTPDNTFYAARSEVSEHNSWYG